GTPLIAFGLLAPALLYQGFVRRACYVIQTPRLAAVAGGLYALLMLLGLFGLSRIGMLSASTAPVIMALASLGPSVWLSRLLGARLGIPDRDSRSNDSAKYTRYARWSVASAILTWTPANLLL